jgi:magnesium transporter
MADQPPTPSPAAPPRIELISYDAEHVDRRTIATLADAAPFLSDHSRRVWLDIEGLHAYEIAQELERLVALHPMASDLLRNGAARAMVEDFGTHRLATMVFLHDARTSEVIDFVFDHRVMVTIQERPGDCFNGVRDRIQAGAGHVRELGAEFLFSLLGRAICDSYQPMLERIAHRIEKIESTLAIRPERGMLTRIHALRTQLMEMRQQVVPLQESIAAITIRLSTPDEEGRRLLLSLRSLQHELAELRDTLDFHRDEVQRLTDLYLNGISNRLNDVMRILTIISTLFMPLSFLASLYGMNFDRSASDLNMPELGWRYGYLGVLGVMCLVSISLIVFFWRKGWLADPTAERRHGLDGLALDMADFIGFIGSRGGRTRTRQRRRPSGSVRGRASGPGN